MVFSLGLILETVLAVVVRQVVVVCAGVVMCTGWCCRRTVQVSPTDTGVGTGVVLCVQVLLSAELRCPRHCVQLATGQYVITQHHSTHCVCIVDTDGQLLTHYQGARGFGPCRDRRPGALAISQRDRSPPQASFTKPHKSFLGKAYGKVWRRNI